MAEGNPNSSREAEPSGELYPPSPVHPPRLTSATGAYRLRVVLVLGSLLLFLLFYLTLVAGSGWMVYWTAWEMPTPRGRAAVFKLGAVLGVCMLFLFFLKGLFKRGRVDTDHYLKVPEKDQPALFGFIRRLCAEAGSPFPRGVYLSHEVNAAVFYPRSLVSLVWPVKKNLLIGLGLVNALNISELKAVLAHEFGHFSQSSMKLGQYVYVANQVIGDMVFGRDRWDLWLTRWRGLDLRLSAPAWALSGVVWVLRQLLSGVFRGINLLNFSLMRQMEFNADLHAVRLTGSDAIISGLWKTERASLAFQMALSDLASLAEHGKHSDDVFFHHRESLGRVNAALEKAETANGALGDLRRPYRPGREIHFRSGDEPATAMWQTHPSTREREANSKRIYVPLTCSEEPAWSLFRSAGPVRRKLSRTAYQQLLGVELRPDRILLSPEQVQRMIEEEREEVKQGEHYFGFYDGRILCPGDIRALAREVDRAALEGSLDAGRLRAEAAAWSGEKLRALRDKTREKESLWEKRGDREQVEREREEFHRKLGDGDRAIFRYYYWKSGANGGSGEMRAELLTRYGFLLAVQEEIKALLPFEGDLRGAVGLLQSGRGLSEDQSRVVLNAFSAAWKGLERTVERMEPLSLPRLSHLDAGQSVLSFILSEKLVAEPRPQSIDGAWIGRFLEQFDQVLGRLRKLHFKNLGLLLKLQEGLDPDLSRTGAPVNA